MTIWHKIRLSNLLMVFTPILVTGAVIITCIKISWRGYWYTLGTMYKDENGIQLTRGLIYTYKKELWERDRETAVLDKSGKMNNLELGLANMGYYILVKRDGEQLYSNIPEDGMGTAQVITGSALDTAKAPTASRKSMPVIKCTFYQGDDSCSVIAMNNDHTDGNVKSYLQSHILRYIFTFAFLCFVLILLVNATLSWWISKSMLKPLKKLSSRASEVRDGSLSVEIDYDKKDEFSKVCQEFNEMREYLRQSVAQRTEYEERRRDLISGISHDLRAPPISIRGYLDGLLEGITTTSQMRERYLVAMKIRTSDLERLADNLSEYSRPENSLYRCQMGQVGLKRYIESCPRENRGGAEKEDVDIDFSYQDGMYYILLDTSESKRVFGNLFTNMIRCRVERKSQISIRLRRMDNGIMAELTPSDGGLSAPSESLKRVFESSYRADAARTHTGEGSGIGSAVVKEIVNNHGGTTHAENRDGLTMITCIPLKGGNMDG